MPAKQLLSLMFADVVNKLNNADTRVSSGLNSAPLSGYVHLLNHGNALFITDDRRSCVITIELALVFQLKTGDRLQAKVTFDPDWNNYIVSEIVSVQRVAYENAPVIKPSRSINLLGRTINLGTSVLISAGDNTDIATKINTITEHLPANLVPMLLSFDGRPTNFNVPTACFTKPKYSHQEKLMACLLTFFQAKQQADIGKDVVLIIDSLDKMFFVFNNCMQPVGTFNSHLFSAAAVNDYENILCTSNNLQAGGSLTIIGLHHTGTSPQLLQINDRLHQIMDTVIN